MLPSIARLYLSICICIHVRVHMYIMCIRIRIHTKNLKEKLGHQVQIEPKQGWDAECLQHIQTLCCLPQCSQDTGKRANALCFSRHV